MRKIIAVIFMFFVSACSAYADNIAKTIHSLGINTGAVSVSVKDVNSGAKIYSLNSNVPMNPASTLKVITSSAALNTLGKDYEYSTELYKSTNNDLYLKLSGDPLLKSSDLDTLITTAVSKNIIPKNFYIDDSMFDSVEWGEGWQWDDDLNPYMPKFSIYNLDKNIVNLEVTPIVNNTPPSIFVKPFYPVTVMNLLITDFKSSNNIKIERNSSIASNIICLSGVVAHANIIQIPVSSAKLYFRLRLESAIKNAKMGYYGTIFHKKLPEKNVYLVSEVKHSVDDIIPQMLKNSDNLFAETLFKTAGAQWSNGQGNLENSVAMLKSFLKELGLRYDDVKVVDGSGVSKNNLVTADFMTDFLIKIADNEKYTYIKESLPTAGEGTLKNRMLYFKDNLRAKTGTLSDISAITGYIKTRQGKNYAFDIMIRDAKTSQAEKKNLEEQILRLIYMN